MLWRTNHRAPLLWRDEDSISFGVHESAVVLAGLTAAEGRVLAALADGAGDGLLDVLCRERGVPITRGVELAAAAGDALLDPLLDRDTPDAVVREISDAQLASRAVTVLERRRRTQISVTGTGELAATVRAALSQMQFATAATAHSGTPTVPAASIAVLICGGAVHPLAYRRLMSARIPHLAIVVDPHCARVLAPVVPGRTPCLRCRACHHVDNDPGVVYALLDAVTRPSPTLDTATLLGTAAAICQSLARLVDDDEIAETTRVTAHGTSAEPAWAVHPACGCRAFEWRDP